MEVTDKKNQVIWLETTELDLLASPYILRQHRIGGAWELDSS